MIKNTNKERFREEPILCSTTRLIEVMIGSNFVGIETTVFIFIRLYNWLTRFIGARSIRHLVPVSGIVLLAPDNT